MSNETKKRVISCKTFPACEIIHFTVDGLQFRFSPFPFLAQSLFCLCYLVQVTGSSNLNPFLALNLKKRKKAANRPIVDEAVNDDNSVNMILMVSERKQIKRYTEGIVLQRQRVRRQMPIGTLLFGSKITCGMLQAAAKWYILATDMTEEEILQGIIYPSIS
ncbi:malic enzyme, partial [Striga asiatica]